LQAFAGYFQVNTGKMQPLQIPDFVLQTPDFILQMPDFSAHNN
jgi:hypothetical protein